MPHGEWRRHARRIRLTEVATAILSPVGNVISRRALRVSRRRRRAMSGSRAVLRAENVGPVDTCLRSPHSGSWRERRQRHFTIAHALPAPHISIHCKSELQSPIARRRRSFRSPCVDRPRNIETGPICSHWPYRCKTGAMQGYRFVFRPVATRRSFAGFTRSVPSRSAICFSY